MRLPLLILGFLIAVQSYSQSKSYTFVFLNSKKSAVELPKDEVEKIMKGHLANIDRLAKEDKLIAAGPFEGGGGIFIFNTTSASEAKEWLSTDPGVQANRWDLEIFPYTPRIGDVCHAKEPYEMVTYHFIRFAEIRGATNQNASELLKKHDEFLSSFATNADVITEGIFSGDGSILILKGDLANGLFENSPAIKHGLLTFNVKKLWIAKGSFCEK